MAIGKADPSWKEKLLDWQASGKSVKAWCREKHIPITTFYGWKNRLEKSQVDKKPIKLQSVKAKQGFIELTDRKPPTPGILLEYNGVKIHLEAEFDPLILRKCLDCLRSGLC
jgi:hypothetical protein